MRIKSWLEEKVIKLIAMIKGEEHTRSLTILPDYETAFMLSIADAYSRYNITPDEFVNGFYQRLRENLVAVKGKGREDVKELYTRREFYEQVPPMKRKETAEGGVNLA